MTLISEGQPSRSLLRAPCGARVRRGLAQELAVGGVAKVEPVMPVTGGDQERSRDHGLRLERFGRPAGDLRGEDGRHRRFPLHLHYRLKMIALRADFQASMKLAAYLAGNTQPEPCFRPV